MNKSALVIIVVAALTAAFLRPQFQRLQAFRVGLAGQVIEAYYLLLALIWTVWEQTEEYHADLFRTPDDMPFIFSHHPVAMVLRFAPFLLGFPCLLALGCIHLPFGAGFLLPILRRGRALVLLISFICLPTDVPIGSVLAFAVVIFRTIQVALQD